MALIQANDNREGEVVLKVIYRMMVNNKNFLAVVTGSTGSGKSYSCLRLAELWYQNYLKRVFPCENICFSVEDLVKRLNSGMLKKGDLLIAEEIGVGANSKNFQSKTNKALQFILQSFRSLNIIVLFNVPHFSFFDKTARMLMHCHIQTLRIDQRKEICILKPYFLNLSQSTGKIYTKWLRVKRKGKLTKVNRLQLRKPTKESLVHYESMKNNFVRELIKEMTITLAKKVEKRETLKPLTPRQAMVFKYLQEGKETGEIAKIMNLSTCIISAQKKFMRTKGYDLPSPENPKKIVDLNDIEQIPLENPIFEA